MDKIRTIEVEVHEDMTATLSYEGKPENFPKCELISISDNFPEIMVLLRPQFPTEGGTMHFCESFIVLSILHRDEENKALTKPIVFFNIETHKGWIKRRSRQVSERSAHVREVLREVELSISE